jgi:hypothetical protein
MGRYGLLHRRLVSPSRPQASQRETDLLVIPGSRRGVGLTAPWKLLDDNMQQTVPTTSADAYRKSVVSRWLWRCQDGNAVNPLRPKGLAVRRQPSSAWPSAASPARTDRDVNTQQKNLLDRDIPYY